MPVPYGKAFLHRWGLTSTVISRILCFRSGQIPAARMQSVQNYIIFTHQKFQRTILRNSQRSRVRTSFSCRLLLGNISSLLQSYWVAYTNFEGETFWTHSLLAKSRLGHESWDLICLDCLNSWCTSEYIEYAFVHWIFYKILLILTHNS